jgi:hypothetical protein
MNDKYRQQYPPEFSVFSNPWEAMVELYRNLG